MEKFGWGKHTEKIEKHWNEVVSKDDLVLIAGDISWAKHLDEAMPDFEWIDSLPGTKVMIKGNHDYWWQAISKLRDALPESIHALQHDAFHWNDVTIGGTKLCDFPEYTFDFAPEPDPKVYERELKRLRMSLEQLDPKANLRIAMTHYPPLGFEMESTKSTAVFEEFGLDMVVFGHLHGMETDKQFFGKKNGIEYIFTACDYLHFKPIRLR